MLLSAQQTRTYDHKRWYCFSISQRQAMAGKAHHNIWMCTILTAVAQRRMPFLGSQISHGVLVHRIGKGRGGILSSGSDVVWFRFIIVRASGHETRTRQIWIITHTWVGSISRTTKLIISWFPIHAYALMCGGIETTEEIATEFRADQYIDYDHCAYMDWTGSPHQHAEKERWDLLNNYYC